MVQRLQTVAPARRRQVLVDLLQDEVAQGCWGWTVRGRRTPRRDLRIWVWTPSWPSRCATSLQERFAPDPPFPATMLFDHPTIADLAIHLLGPILGFEKPEEPEPDAALEQSRQTIVDEIEQLSEKELATLVAGELQALFPSPDSNGGVN